jgi:plasmid stabilization system protein ParE
MTRRWILRPLAQADLDDAATWYEGQQPDLGSRFLDAIDHVFKRFVKPRCNSLPFPLVFDERCCRPFR